MINSFIKISNEIKNALKKKKPIVALESTLISHGLPYPKNIEVAKKSIDNIYAAGSIPATIGIINGNITVGLTDEDIKTLATNKKVEKVSRHNIALNMFKNKFASTTVASTIMIASLLGIKVFSTGGIGGVHRDAEKTFDISSDLLELQKSNMIVVCSGPKSILDLEKTNEMLETLGISKIGYRINKIPGFWVQETNLNVDIKLNKINDLLIILKNKKLLKQSGSLLIYNSVPKKDSIDNVNVEKWISKALKNSKNKKISGKELTPFLLKEISNFSKDLTLKANISLILNNSKLAGKIAYKLNRYLWK